MDLISLSYSGKLPMAGLYWTSTNNGFDYVRNGSMAGSYNKLPNQYGVYSFLFFCVANKN